MSKLRSVSTAFWSDPFIEDLTSEEKLLFLYLITNEKTNMLGIYEASVKKMSFETGLTIETVRNGLKEFERLSKVKYIKNYVILVNFLKHQNFNTNMKKSAIDIYNSLPKELKDSDLNISKSNPSEGFESLSKHFGMVSKIEVEYETEYEVEKESKYNLYKDRSDLEMELLNSHTFQEQVFRQLNGVKQIATMEQILKLIPLFCEELEIKEDLDRELKDIKIHFIRWAKLEIPKINRNESKQSSHDKSKQSYQETANAIFNQKRERKSREIDF